jgi:membrane protease YdiL (CAAX protease family)
LSVARAPCYFGAILDQGVDVLDQTERPSLPPAEAIAWGPRDIAFAIALALAVGFVLVSLIVAPIAAASGSSNSVPALTAGIVVTLLFDVALFGSAAFFSVMRYRSPWSVLGLRPLSTKELWPGLVTAIVAHVIIGVYAGLVRLLGVDNLLPGTNVPEKLFEERLVLPLTGVATVLVAPLAEETFFRGFVFGGLRRYGFFWAALVSGVLFSAAHLSVGGLLPLALVGILFAWVYSRTGSLWTNVYAHLIFNLVSFVALAATQGGGSV